eukprot:3218227-Rhodomonas_salina.3
MSGTDLGNGYKGDVELYAVESGGGGRLFSAGSTHRNQMQCAKLLVQVVLQRWLSSLISPCISFCATVLHCETKYSRKSVRRWGLEKHKPPSPYRVFVCCEFAACRCATSRWCDGCTAADARAEQALLRAPTHMLMMLCMCGKRMIAMSEAAGMKQHSKRML